MAGKGSSLVLASLLALASAGCSSGPKERDPKAAQDYYAKAEKVAKKGDHVEAIELYSKAIEADPQFPDAYYQRGWHYLQARSMEKPPCPGRELVDRALNDYTLAIRWNPSYGEAYFNRAVIHASRASYKAAIEDFLVASRYMAKDPEPELHLGQLYETYIENAMPLALKHYEEYLIRGGKNPDIREKVVVWKQLQGKPDQPRKEPTAEDEKKAEELYKQLLAAAAQEKAAEAGKFVEELVTKYSHTKFYKDNTRAITTLYTLYKPKPSDPPK